MAEYISISPDVEVIGGVINAVIAGVGDECIPILEKYNLYPIINEKWYKQQDFLNAFKELNEGNFLNLVAIGMRIPDNAIWPPDVKTVHDALASINVAYQMNNRNGEIGGYYYTQTGPNSGTMVCKNPFPSNFDYGLIYRTVQKFRESTDIQFVVKRDDSIPNRLTGADSCTYNISW